MRPRWLRWPCLGALALLCLALGPWQCAQDSHRPGPSAPAPLRVAPDGSGDYPDIASALAAALDGDTILLADGRYQGAGNVDLDPAGKSVVLKSQSLDPTLCIIDCQGSDSTAHRGFFIHSGEDSSCRIEGITVTHGYTQGPPGSLDRAGGAVHCRESSSPTFVNCAFTENYADYCGGAVVIAHESNPVFESCSFEQNGSTWGGALCALANSSPAFENCRFEGNGVSNSGGALYASRATVSLLGCLLAGNDASQGGAISCADSSSILIIGCTVAENAASYAGGALQCAEAAVRLEQCTLVGNSSTQGAGIFCQVNSDIVLRSSILAFSTHGEAVACLDWSCLLDVQCCDVHGNTGGDWSGCLEGALGQAGNISGDPLFLDRANGDYRLAPASPCGPDSSACGAMGAWSPQHM